MIRALMKTPLARQLKQHALAYQPVALLSQARWSLASHWHNRERLALDHTCVSLRTPRNVRGQALVSYIIDAVLEPGRPLPKTHTNIWQTRQMAHTLLDLGFDVDVISWRNQAFRPLKPYQLVVDVRHNLERLSPFLPTGCIKVFHIDTAHTVFQNAAEASRLLALQERRGITLGPKRFERPNHAIEHAAVATTTGNAFTIRTFQYAKKPIYRVPVPATLDCPWIEEKDWEQCRRRFLWLSSWGLVHKGLDLALDAFAAMPQHHLTVCAPIEGEPDFVRAYEKELFRTRNIEYVGFVDIDGSRMRQLAASCGAVLNLSCSEGGGGSTVNGMHAGLIPIVTDTSSVDVDPGGLCVPEATVTAVQDAVVRFASHPASDLRQRARTVWESVRRFHTREQFAAEYARILTALVQDPVG